MAATYTLGKNPTTFIDGLRVYANTDITLFPNPSNLDLRNSVINTGAAVEAVFTIQSTVQTQSATVSQCVIEGAVGQKYCDVRKAEDAGNFYEGNYNVLWPLITNSADSIIYRGTDGGTGQVSKTTLATGQSEWGYEMNSVAVDPLFVDPINGDFRIGVNGGIPNVGLSRPHIKYTPTLKTEAEAISWLLYGEVI